MLLWKESTTHVLFLFSDAARAVFSAHLRLTSSFLEIPTAAADGLLLRPPLVSTLRKLCNKCRDETFPFQLKFAPHLANQQFKNCRQQAYIRSCITSRYTTNKNKNKNRNRNRNRNRNNNNNNTTYVVSFPVSLSASFDPHTTPKRQRNNTVAAKVTASLHHSSIWILLSIHHPSPPSSESMSPWNTTVNGKNTCTSWYCKYSIIY